MKFALWICLVCCFTNLGLAVQMAAAEVAVSDSIRKYRFLAKTARDKKDYDDALKYYGEYLKYESDTKKARKAHYYVGQIHFTRKDFAAAKQAFKQALALDSLSVNPNLMLYKLYQSAQPDSAAQYLERVVRARPDELQHRRKLADLYRRLNQTRAAIRHYDWIVEAEGGDEELFGLLAVLHEDLGEVSQALAWHRRLLEAQGLASDSSRVGRDEKLETLESILGLQLQTGDAEGAFESLVKLVESDPENRYSYYSQMADLAEENDDKTRRIKGLEGMARSNPKDLETVAVLVELYLHDDRPDRARQWLERGLRIDENNAYLQVCRGDLLLLEGAEEEALAAYEKAKADPAWEQIAQQRIWKLRPPETEEEKLKREFFGAGDSQE